MEILKLWVIFVTIVANGQTLVQAKHIQDDRWSGEGCAPPEVALPELQSNNKKSSTTPQHTDFKDVMEVKFSGAIGPLGERRLCKIKCIGGEWVGPLCQLKDVPEGGRFQPLFRSCRLEALPPQLLVTYRNVSVVTLQGLGFPHGSQVSVRCRELGLYKLLGESALQCQNGAWSHRVPNCIPTTMVTNFTEDAPPTLLVRVPAGSASVEADGELAVFPGSIVHLECVFARRLGNPEWTWTSTFRQYLTGWAIASEEREWKYRLSIYYSKPQDSGTFTCSTPRGLTNSITIHVTAVHCEPLEVDDPHVTARVEGSRLGHTAIFQCPMGYRLNGTVNITCHASGKWSGPAPRCTPVLCPSLRDEVNSDPRQELLEQNTSYGGRAVFRCNWGYRLSGPPGLECEADGRWSGPAPRCVPVLCSPPQPPINGRTLESGSRPLPDGRYAVGTAVQFGCAEGHLLVGEATIVCTETGFWSHPAPFCKAQCPYPGDPENGMVVPVKFFYEPGDHVKVTCLAGFVVRETAKPTCRPDGTWSEQIPACLSYSEV